MNKNNTVKVGNSSYKVKPIEIKSISFEVDAKSTDIYIKYIGFKHIEFALKIPNKNGAIDTSLMSDCYIAIVQLNKQILKESVSK